MVEDKRKLVSRKALFIVFEGIDGAGKSTQIRLLKRFLSKKKIKYLALREPGSTLFGEKIRKILLRFKRNISPISELFLYLASRNQLVYEKLEKELSKKQIIICDRFYHSTIAYQGTSCKMNQQELLKLNLLATNKIKPDKVILLDVNPKEALRNLSRKKDRIEKKGVKFYKEVRKAFLALARKNKDIFITLKVDRLSNKEVFEKIINKINPIITKKFSLKR